MEIKIEHIAKIEGHAGFVADIVRGDVKKAKIEIEQGKRFLEKILQGRSFADAAIICSRICGICPVVHQITCLRAVENAFSVEPGPETVNLRKIMLAGQMIQSHALHLFFLSMNRELLPIRDFGNRLIEIIGGRSVHPITPKVGGFEKFPEKKKIENLMEKYKETLKLAQKFNEFYHACPVMGSDEEGNQITELIENHKAYANSNPVEWAAYIQDKIELKDMVVNIGIRYDYFNSRWKIAKASLSGWWYQALLLYKR